jgi:hypothetical protein
MLEAIPTNIFSSNFRLQQNDNLLGEVEASIWRDRAVLEIGEGTYQLYREGQFSGDFVLEHNGNVVARARKPSLFRNQFEVELPNQLLLLRKLAPLSRRFGLFDGERQLGSVYPLGIFTRRSNIDLPSDWPLPIRAFVFWLAFIIWKRQNAAAAS